MLTVLPELLRGAAEYKDFLTGLLLLLLLIFLPKGVVGAVAKKVNGSLFGLILRNACHASQLTCMDAFSEVDDAGCTALNPSRQTGRATALGRAAPQGEGGESSTS